MSWQKTKKHSKDKQQYERQNIAIIMFQANEKVLIYFH